MEVGNKPSLMGIYGPEMIFPADVPPDAPITVPKLAIVTWLFCDIDGQPKRLSIHFYGPPGRTEITKFDIPQEHITQPASQFDDATRVQVQLQVAGLPLLSEGILEITVETEQEDHLRAGRLRVRIPGRPDPGIDNSPPPPVFTEGAEPLPQPSAEAKRRASRKRR